jgi:hypothetical protein
MSEQPESRRPCYVCRGYTILHLVARPTPYHEPIAIDLCAEHCEHLGDVWHEIHDAYAGVRLEAQTHDHA